MISTNQGRHNHSQTYLSRLNGDGLHNEGNEGEKTACLSEGADGLLGSQSDIPAIFSLTELTKV